MGLEAEMPFPVREAYDLPTNMKSFVESFMTRFFKSKYSVQMVVVEVSSQRILFDRGFSVPKCLRLARMSRPSHQEGVRSSGHHEGR